MKKAINPLQVQLWIHSCQKRSSKGNVRKYCVEQTFAQSFKLLRNQFLAIKQIQLVMQAAVKEAHSKMGGFVRNIDIGTATATAPKSTNFMVFDSSGRWMMK